MALLHNLLKVKSGNLFFFPPQEYLWSASFRKLAGQIYSLDFDLTKLKTLDIRKQYNENESCALWGYEETDFHVKIAFALIIPV